MISVKGGTQTWSKAEQTSSLTTSNVQNMAAGEMQKALGNNEDLGELLNKVADPNWVDPKKTRQVGNANLDKDAFLKLFLAQLKNQDPTKPMESHDMAAQLAQFTQLEKLNNIDSSLTTMAKAKNPSTQFDALNLIGKAVAGDSSKIFRTDKGDTHEIGFKLAAEATEATVQIKNKVGVVVKELALTDLKQGKNVVNWDGTDINGRPSNEGEYYVSIEAKASNGKKVFAETKFEGKISGVNYTAAGPVLLMGRQTVKLSDVKKIFNANEIGNAKVNKAVATEKKTQESEAGAAQSSDGNLSSVGMSRGMINKLEKNNAKVAGVN